MAEAVGMAAGASSSMGACEETDPPLPHHPSQKRSWNFQPEDRCTWEFRLLGVASEFSSGDWEFCWLGISSEISNYDYDMILLTDISSNFF